jgi:hypothetical protein
MEEFSVYNVIDREKVGILGQNSRVLPYFVKVDSLKSISNFPLYRQSPHSAELEDPSGRKNETSLCLTPPQVECRRIAASNVFLGRAELLLSRGLFSLPSSRQEHPKAHLSTRYVSELPNLYNSP